jgi:hypothetical protein
MAITIDGNSLVFEGTVTITNFTDPTTGVCTLTLTPTGGVGNLPVLAQGLPGQPTLFDSISVNTLSAGSLATASLDLVDPGDAGESAHYTLTLGIPEGATGSNGSSGVLSEVSDLSGTAAVGDIIRVSSLSPTAFTYAKTPLGNVYNATGISSVSGTGAGSVIAVSMSLPAQGYDWYPLCFAQCVVAGTAKTVVNLKALLNDATNGDQVGFCSGNASATSQTLTMIPSFGALLGTGYAKVSAGDTAEVFLGAIQTANVKDAWSISGTTIYFTVLAFQVAS